MTTGLKSKATGNPDLDSVFDPYVQGTSPPATGFNVGGTSIDIAGRYAPIVFGSAAAATGLLTAQAGHADLNTLFAAFGTANYALPINGGTYVASNHRDGTAGPTCIITFVLSSGTNWNLTPSGVGGTVTPGGTFASGTIPAGAATVRYTGSLTAGAGTITNGASTATAVGSNPNINLRVNGAGTIGGATATAAFKVEFLNSGGTVISTTNFTVQTIITPP